jgi:hypothetical protein
VTKFKNKKEQLMSDHAAGIIAGAVAIRNSFVDSGLLEAMIANLNHNKIEYSNEYNLDPMEWVHLFRMVISPKGMSYLLAAIVEDLADPKVSSLEKLAEMICGEVDEFEGVENTKH